MATLFKRRETHRRGMEAGITRNEAKRLKQKGEVSFYYEWAIDNAATASLMSGSSCPGGISHHRDVICGPRPVTPASRVKRGRERGRTLVKWRYSRFAIVGIGASVYFCVSL